jgi:predicted Zn-dependent protease
VRARFLVATLALAFAPGCALLGAVGGPAINVNSSTVRDIKAATEESDRREAECKAFASRTVPYPEEVSIGGAIALSLAKKTKSGVYVELSPEVAAAGPINPALAGKKITPGSGDRTELNRYVNLIGKGLASYSSRPSIDWTFAVLDSATPNAFSAPGGYVFVTTGMLKQLENEAQLAAVLGHEIGHVTGRHALTSYQKAKGTTCSLANAASTVGAVGGAVARPAPFASEIRGLMGAVGFDPDKASADLIRSLADNTTEFIMKVGFKDLEKDADATATRLMVLAGYDSAEFEKLLNKLPEGSFFTPHPTNKARIEVVKATRAELEGFSGSKVPPLAPIVRTAIK